MTKRTETYYQIICKLACEKSFIEGDFTQFAKEIVNQSFQLFNCSRMSFWLIDFEKSELHCKFYYEGKSYLKGPVIAADVMPNYFKTIRENRTINISNAQENANTKELNDVYFKKEGIVSLLDSAIYDGPQIIGIFSLEHKSEKAWDIDTVNFARVLSDLLSNCYVLHKRIEAEKNLRNNQRKLHETNLTLQNLITQFEQEKKNQQENIALNIEKNVLPVLRQIKDQVDEQYYQQIKVGLSNLSSNFYKKLARFNYSLTPTEIKVCQLLRSGMRGKEIAHTLNLSFHTIETHKKNIRKKLGLTGRPINLRVAIEELMQD